MSCDGNSFDLILHLPFTDKDGNTETSYKFTDIDVMGNQNNEARINIANMLNNNNYDQTNNIFETDNTLKKSVSDFIKEETDNSGQCFLDGQNTLNLNNCTLIKTCNNNKITVDMNCHNHIVAQYVSSKSSKTSSSPDNIQELNNGYAICERGYLAEGSYVFNERNPDMDMIYGPYVRNGSYYEWKNDTDTDKQWSGECVLQSCPPLSIMDSDREFDVVTGDLKNNEPIDIHCNDGYIFNSGEVISQKGQIYCDYSNNKTGNLKADINWYVYNPGMEEFCKTKQTEEECIATPSNPDALGSGEYCVWSKQINKLDVNESIGTNITLQNPIKGECLYRKPVHKNDSDPICAPRYCPSMAVEKSNRDISNPLPGPPKGRLHGLCFNSSGEEIKDVYGNTMKSSADCMCQKHRSCKTCSQTPGCQWCGSETQSIIDKGGPQCFSTLTENPMCAEDVKSNNRGGSCASKLESNKGELKPDFDPKTGTEADCVSNTCVNTNTLEIIPKAISDYIGDFTPGAIGTAFDNQDLCVSSWNNVWSDTGVRHTDNECIFKNKKMEKYSSSTQVGRGLDINFNGGKGIPSKESGVASYGSISINENICKAKSSSADTDVVSKCAQKTTRQLCMDDNMNMDDNTCEWVPNDLSDRRFNWTNNSISDTNNHHKVFFRSESNTNKCYKCSYKSSDSSKESYLSGKKIPVPDLNCKEVTPDTMYTVTKNMDGDDDDDDDNDKLYIKDSDKNELRIALYSNTINNCKLNMDPSNKFKIDENSCSVYEESNTDGFACYGGEYYCVGDNCSQNSQGNYTSNSNEERCIANNVNCVDLDEAKCDGGMSLDGVEANSLEINCRLNYNNSFLCTKPDINCSKDNFEQISPPSSTEFQGSNSIDVFKNFMTVDFNLDQANSSNFNNMYKNASHRYMCSQIDDDKAHYGSICKNDSNSIPVKQLCEATGNIWEYNGLSYNGEWGCYYKQDSITNFGLSGLAENAKITDQQICSHLNTTGNNANYNLLENKCILEVDSNNDTYQDMEMRYCDSYDNYDKKFIYETNSRDTGKGSCTAGKSRPANDTQAKSLNTRSKSTIAQSPNKESCYIDNHSFIQEYEYSNDNTCPKTNQISDDILTLWTGGNTTTVDSDCSSSILSSCNVQCDKGYGGGGDYICHYEPVDIDCSKFEDNGSCDENIHCIWNPKGGKSNSGECIKDNSVDVGGELKWQGSECYLLDNDAFAHGILNLPSLDQLLPPLIRVLIFFIIIIPLIFMLFWKLGPKDEQGVRRGILQRVPKLILTKSIKALILLFTNSINIFVTILSAITNNILNPVKFILYIVNHIMNIRNLVKKNYGKVLVIIGCIAALIAYLVTKPKNDDGEDEIYSLKQEFDHKLDSIQDDYLKYSRKVKTWIFSNG